MRFQKFFLVVMLAVSVLGAGMSAAQGNGPLRLEITEGVIEPLPYALPIFQAENREAQAYTVQISQVISADLTGTGLFREIAPSAFISNVTLHKSLIVSKIFDHRQIRQSHLRILIGQQRTQGRADNASRTGQEDGCWSIHTSSSSVSTKAAP